MTIGIVLLATNAYFPLGIRFIKKFKHFYTGKDNIVFYFFSDRDPRNYLTPNSNVEYFNLINTSWQDATNSKFRSIIDVGNTRNCDYIFYFDADTNINQKFDEQWFIGDMVGGQHFGDQDWMKITKNFDRNPMSKAYIPTDTNLHQMYFYGAFFGGSENNITNFCKTLESYQKEDSKLPYEPCANDESYINKEFHYNPPSRIVYNKDFKFAISDKGGIQNMRDSKKDVQYLLNDILELKLGVFDVRDNKVVKIVS